MPVKKKMNGKGQGLKGFTMPTFGKPTSPTRVAPAPALTRVPAVKKGIQVKGMTRAGLKDKINMGERMIDMKEAERETAKMFDAAARKKGEEVDSHSRSAAFSGKIGLDSLRENVKLEKEELKEREEEDEKKNTVVGKLKKLVGSGGELTKIESSIKKLRAALKKKK
jgi:hypothetical protein